VATVRKEIFTVKELADHIGCSVDLIYDSINQGFLEASRLGSGVIRITRQAVFKWIASRKIMPGVKPPRQKQTLELEKNHLEKDNLEKTIENLPQKQSDLNPFFNL